MHITKPVVITTPLAAILDHRAAMTLLFFRLKRVPRGKFVCATCKDKRRQRLQVKTMQNNSLLLNAAAAASATAAAAAADDDDDDDAVCDVEAGGKVKVQAAGLGGAAERRSRYERGRRQPRAADAGAARYVTHDV
jgi:hypothetical protein